MLLVLVILLGAVSDGARLSFDIGPLKIQPAEFAKVTVLLALAAYLGEDERDDDDGLTYARFVGGLLLVGVPTVLIIVQPDLGSASVLIAMAMGVLLVAGARAKYIVLITFCRRPPSARPWSAGSSTPTSRTASIVFFNTDNSNATPAAARPDLPGPQRAAGHRHRRHRPARAGCRVRSPTPKDIPVQWADFPFSAIGEQFGLVGCGVVHRPVRHRPAAHLAHRPPVARHARHLPLRRRVHDAAVAGVPERGDDASG